jgi:hypothetical protein
LQRAEGRWKEEEDKSIVLSVQVQDLQLKQESQCLLIKKKDEELYEASRRHSAVESECFMLS